MTYHCQYITLSQSLLLNSLSAQLADTGTASVEVTALQTAKQSIIFNNSDVKRGLNLEAETEAKDKVTNKKYQMMVDNIQANLYHYDQNDTV